MALPIWLRLARRHAIIKTDFGSGAAGSALEGGLPSFPSCLPCDALAQKRSLPPEARTPDTAPIGVTGERTKRERAAGAWCTEGLLDHIAAAGAGSVQRSVLSQSGRTSARVHNQAAAHWGGKEDETDIHP